MTKIVLWRPMYASFGADRLRESGAEVVVVDSSAEADVIAAVADADALWVRYPENVTRAVLEAAPRLSVVSTSGFGTDRVDVEAATELGILVVNHVGFGRIPVSEHTIMLILALLKHLPWAISATRDGTAWDARSDLETAELYRKTVGVVGLGYVGSEIARKLSLGFGATVLAYDPYVDPRIGPLVGAEMVTTLDELLSRSTILALAPALDATTRNMIGTAELARMPRGSLVVNCSRGGIVDTDALVDALDSGHIAAAAVDVVQPEPLPAGHRLLTHPQAIVTPHTAGLTAETVVRMTESAVSQLTSALAGRMPACPVNPQAWSAACARRKAALAENAS